MVSAKASTKRSLWLSRESECLAEIKKTLWLVLAFLSSFTSFRPTLKEKHYLHLPASITRSLSSQLPCVSLLLCHLPGFFLQFRPTVTSSGAPPQTMPQAGQSPPSFDSPSPLISLTLYYHHLFIDLLSHSESCLTVMVARSATSWLSKPFLET